MSSPPSPTPSGRNAEDVKLGLIQVPLLVPLCLFSPFFLTFIVFVIYRFTVVRYRNKKTPLAQGSEQEVVEKDVEMQLQKFLGKSENR
ncbi:hypothetical protein HBI56_162910 [Parastagonospora nodorum]|nr:hypothetical protein HBH56_125190 [Parastagonospora nodorum]KAH3931638.1 hypothetical protein HBH54_098320 [Parastagonospora nodorum]KAH3944383.1 hypothetical protein HBH53_159790 [Parastagonospora nodorum]KAH3956881.1 hypothetical protein HBH51_233500 [Parastagonospora nodorum]KAH3971603.1 hypothetical protein HBH52_154290 [Parastagonospora nodorum]